MRIAIKTETGDFHNLEVDSQIELENIKALIEAETGTPPAEQIILHNEREMTDPKRTLEQYGVKQDETLYLRKRSPAVEKIRIAITTEAGDLHNLEVDSQVEFENIKALIEAKTGIPSAEQIISYHGQEMTDPKRTLKQYGVIQDEILYLRRSPAFLDVTRAEQMRQTVLGNPHMLQQLHQTQPELANAVDDPIRFATLIQQMVQRRSEGELQRAQQISLLNADPFNIEAQRRIEEAIRMENVMANLDAAIEFTPESFGRVTMLYINVEVNKHPVKAFVDSGAQVTIMTPQCAETCGIMRLVDRRFSGIAEGVGTAKILGKIHSVPIRVGSDFLACSFTIMEGQAVELLFGLDMLKRHQACIDLKKNALVINGNEIPFLPEHELPRNARTEEISGSLQSESSSSSSNAVSNVPPVPFSPISSTTTNPLSNPSPPVSQSQYPEEHINNLVSMGISRAEAIKLLDATNGNVEMAASLYFG